MTFIIWATFLILSPINSIAATPEKISGTTKINAEGLIELIQNNPELIVFDARMKEDRYLGYIEDTISLPDIDTTCESLASFITKENHPIAFYCNGPQCGRSVKSAKVALKCGYNNIYWYRGGFQDWKEKNYPYITK